MLELDHLPGRTFWQNGQEWLYFSGTAYLGMPHLPGFRDLLQEGMARYGTNFGGSRRSNMQLSVFSEAEQQLADWVGTEAALTVSSGSLAGQLLVRFLRKLGPCYFSPYIHPALWPDDYVASDLTFSDWVDQVARVPARGENPIPLLCASVDPLRARDISFDWLGELPADRRYWVVIDDSHGLGILGRQGGGIFRTLPDYDHIEYLIVGSLAKGPGLPGGGIFGRRILIDQLWRSPFFIGASPMVPAYLYAWQRSGPILARQLTRLQQNIGWLENQWPGQLPVRHQSAYPVFYVPDPLLGQRLANDRILISSFPYPGPNDPLLNRIVVSALHQEEDLTRLVAHLSAL